ncbi:hypothetical protein RRG08_036982 [Elysia crispata]|uniref:Uncharacterized protein n=1 Tax=Elysia crispata TaxID=231223 RepID=A0AAE0XTK4_9GAST|nr:hypothetical protein RRG08_036982 [Elysia crispata]
MSLRAWALSRPLAEQTSCRGRSHMTRHSRQLSEPVGRPDYLHDSHEVISRNSFFVPRLFLTGLKTVKSKDGETGGTETEKKSSLVTLQRWELCPVSYVQRDLRETHFTSISVLCHKSSEVSVRVILQNLCLVSKALPSLLNTNFQLLHDILAPCSPASRSLQASFEYKTVHEIAPLRISIG